MTSVPLNPSRGLSLRADFSCRQMPLPEQDLGGGKCWRARQTDLVVDTVIIHTCYVTPTLKGDFTAQLQGRPPSEAVARELRNEWKRNPSDQKSEFAGIRSLIEGCRGLSALEPFSVEGIFEIFRFYGVSAHYLIDRDGQVTEFVPPEFVAFHAGRSKLPSDGREGVNEFSVGVELLATETSGITASQRQSLVDLVAQLRGRYPLTQFYGHDEIAPGRKADPWGFDCSAFRALFNA